MYGAMRDFHADAQHLSSPHHASMSCIPVHAWDLLTGAASGTAAVLVSMPLDVIKTYMQTHGTDLTGKGIISSASLFINTGQKLVRRGGFGALYLGVTPRLIQQVPSAMVCWWSIEALSRALEPHTVQHREQGTIGIAGSASAFEATTAAVAVCAAGKQENVCSGS